MWNVNVAPSAFAGAEDVVVPDCGHAPVIAAILTKTAPRRYAAIWEKKGWDTYVGDVADAIRRWAGFAIRC